MTTLSVSARTTYGKKVKELRSNGLIPGVLYGHGVEPRMITVNALAFDKVYRQAGETTLVDVALDAATPVKVLIQDVQVDHQTSAVTHVDLHQVRMDEKLQVDIPLRFVGEAPAVKEFGGVLVKSVSELKVECLPKDLVHELEVDLSSLKELEKGLRLEDLTLPAGFKVLNLNPEDTIVFVEAPRSDAELAALKTEVKDDVSAVEVEEKGKKEEEGSAPAEAK